MKLTRKELQELATALDAKIVRASYGHLPFNSYTEGVKLGYNTGVYGWNWDAFYFNGIVYCYGYRNLIGDEG